MKSLIHKKERLYFTLAIITSIFAYILLGLTVVGILIFAALMAAMLFFHALMMAQIRTNAVKLSPAQFPEMNEIVNELCVRMEMPKVPDVYVMESSGVLNAFATRFFGRNMVVLYSEVFELSKKDGQEELTFVIAHELAHLKRRHITKQMLIFPVLCVPFASEAYSRACEYTCDRMAAHYTDNAEAAINGLTVLAVGKSLYKDVNRQEYLQHSSEERGFFAWLAEKLSTHPTLPKRIYEIQKVRGDAVTGLFRASKKAAFVGVIGLVLITALTYGAYRYTDQVADVMANAIIGIAGETDITIAAANGDAEQLQSLIDAGSDVNYQDGDGWTALMYSVNGNRPDLMKMLLEAGADPNIAENTYEDTALTMSLNHDTTDAVELLVQHDAVVNLQDSYGITPLMIAALSGRADMVQVLMGLGADPGLQDNDGRTAHMFASDEGHEEVAKLLK
ncbi:hypothetical protein SY83_03810 [Paenibacillus swuensis]|uniref:Peptidase M48 domain-containing protein n=1 Tax=Paenibacillus swuensis TaxID=1178515 RepID=A0A172TNS8_9BACL|nr:M48 family metallopeptidase [Paenibacillus swuensis]ANE48711.1 hypothetical protein SY83_03810 [Paenibacillus swuensis]